MNGKAVKRLPFLPFFTYFPLIGGRTPNRLKRTAGLLLNTCLCIAGALPLNTLSFIEIRF